MAVGAVWEMFRAMDWYIVNCFIKTAIKPLREYLIVEWNNIKTLEKGIPYAERWERVE